MIALKQYMGVVYQVIGKLNYPYDIKDDLISEGFLALHQASKYFNEDLGYPFQSYAHKAVYLHLIKYIDSFNKKTFLSIDEFVGGAEDDENTFASLIEGDDQHQMIEDKDYYNYKLSLLTPVEKFVVQRYFEEDMTTSRIVKIYGEMLDIRSWKTVQNIINKVTDND